MLKLDFCKEDADLVLNRPSTIRGAWCMLDGKHYHFVGVVVLFLETHVDEATGFVRDVPMTVVPTKYSELVIKLFKDCNGEENSPEKVLQLSEAIIRWKELVKNTFGTYC